MKDRIIEQHRIAWRGIAISVDYEPNYLSSSNFQSAHLSITAINPERVRLPITETGYRSHFVSRDAVDAMGGPAAYVTAWPEAESRSPKWKAAEHARRQLSLF